MSTVILAEKPSQAKSYAEAFKKSIRKDGYYEVDDQLFNGKTYITYAIGHLVELANPEEYNKEWKDWRLEYLPMIPKNYIFKISKNTNKQFNVVKRLLTDARTIIIATDCDREGENIAWSIIKQCNADRGKTYKRLWINSLETDVIREGFSNLKNGLDYVSYYEEAKTRQISDWLVGMNASRLYTMLLQQKGIKDSFSLGRVQTPTLYMIYKRQKEIESFKRSIYYELESEISNKKGTFIGKLNPIEKFKNTDDIIFFLKAKGITGKNNKGIVESIERKRKTTSSPLLFSLSGLQSKINSLYKATANEVLQATQNLYEKKLLSYPRSDSNYITTNELDYLKSNFNNYISFLGINTPPERKEPSKRYVDNKMVQEHYAIIPTKRIATKEEFTELSILEKQIYKLVMKTTVAMFYPLYEYDEVIVHTKLKELDFQTKANIPIKKGWKSFFDKETKTAENKENIMVTDVSEGDEVNMFLREVKKETKPLKYFTEGTLLTSMKRAGNDLDESEDVEIMKEVEGIGTEATRASIIEVLKERKYIVLKKNNLYVTEKGMLLCDVINDGSLLKSPKLTAKWENYLKKIGNKEGSQKVFLANIEKFIKSLTETVPINIKDKDLSEYKVGSNKSHTSNDGICDCPKCDGKIVKKNKIFGCTNYPKCKFSLFDNFRNKKYSKKQVKDLIMGKDIILTKIKSKKSNEYDAILHLDDITGKVEMKGFA